MVWVVQGAWGRVKQAETRGLGRAWTRLFVNLTADSMDPGKLSGAEIRSAAASLRDLAEIWDRDAEEVERAERNEVGT